MDFPKLTIEYIEGRISPSEYEALLEKDPGLYHWIQGIAPADETVRIFHRELKIPQEFPYDVRLVLKKYDAIDEGGPRGSLSYHYFIHQHIVSLFQKAFPDISLTVDPKPAMLYELALFVCPSYIGGREVNDSCILSELLGDIPTDWPTGKRNKEAKARIKKAFHIEGSHYPRWIQSPEWPMIDGEPMQFVKTQKVNTEHVQHVFRDPKTGVQRIVDDFY